MAERYLLPMARCPETGQRQKTQDLTGARFTLRQRGMCQEVADRLADTLTQRTGRQWLGIVVEYTPSVRLPQR